MTRLSSKGQVIIPKSVRENWHWNEGQEFFVENIEEGILLKPKNPFNQTSLLEVVGCLKHEGKKKTEKEIKAIIKKSWKEKWHESH